MIRISGFLVLITFFVLLVSCGKKKDIPSSEVAIPADSLISEENMVHVLADAHMIEAALVIERNIGVVSTEKPGLLYQGIFNKYHISRARYDENLRYYRQNPTLLTKMYDKVIGELETRQKKFHPGR
jgi:hypothetical protein